MRFESRRVRSHLENILGKSPADVLLRHMRDQYGVDITEGSGTAPFCPVEPLEKTLSDVLGGSYATMLVGELAAESGAFTRSQQSLRGGGGGGSDARTVGRRSSVGSVITEVHAA